jgi:AcrR family transcriptional regulator
VVDAAVRLADGEGLGNLTLARLADRLKIRPPSLFNHIKGLPDLRRQLQLRALREMVAVASRAAVGRSGDDAVMASAIALRRFAHEHPGLHAASLPSVAARDRELAAAAEQFVGIFFDVVRGYGFQGKEVVHAVRGLFSIIHGFIMLERAGNFGMPIDIEESFRWLVRRYIESLHGDGQRRPAQHRLATRSR